MTGARQSRNAKTYEFYDFGSSEILLPIKLWTPLYK